MSILNLIQNIALLVALAALYQVVASRFRVESVEYQAISGLLFGAVGIIGMMTPLHFMPGMIFDGRSIILSISGLFGGPVVATVSGTICGAYRLYVGGPGVYVGLATIFESVALGVVFHYLWKRKVQPIGLFRLWLFGLLVSAITLITFLGLPKGAGIEVIKQIGLTILTFYPLATMLVCQLFLDYERQISDSIALYKSESLYRGVFQNAAVGVDVVDSKGKFLQANSTLCSMLGYTEKELLELSILDITHPEDRLTSAFMHQQMVKGQTDSYKIRKRYFRKDGEIVWAEVSVSAVYGAHGAHHATIGVISDITAQKNFEDALDERERMWVTMLGNLPGFVYRCANDPQWTMQYVSAGCVDVTGYAPEDLVSNNSLSFNDLVDPDYQKKLWEKWQYLLDKKEPFEDEYPIITKTGARRWVWERGRGIFGNDGELLFLEGFITDVTERRQTEEALRESRHRYQELFEKSRLQEELYLSMLNCSADPIIVYDMDGKVQFLNPAHTEMFGWALEEVKGKRLETVPDWDREATTTVIDKIVHEGKTNRSYETQRLTKDGRLLDVSISGARYHDHTGAPAGMLVIIQNISERKKAQEAQRRLATAIEQAAEAVIITNSAGIIQYVNPAFEMTTGYSREEAIGQKPSILKSGMHDAEFYKELWKTIKAGEVWSGRFINRKKDGSFYYEEATISPVRDSLGKINNFVAVKRDVTETVELTRQLLHSQKMEAIGTLAGGIAHDFNNLLQVVLGYCEILMGNRELKGSDHEDLKKIHSAGKKGAELVKKLLTFSRNEETKLVHVNLNTEITHIRDLLYRTITKSIKIHLHLSGDLNPVKADPSQITQILMNLAVNARDAMPDGGILTIKTENALLDDEYCSRLLEIKPGRYVALTVSDTGFGMEKETMEHIFEPFFSTKDVGKGTGLGLATVYGIVKQHNGHLICESEPGTGTTFRIYFPAVTD